MKATSPSTAPASTYPVPGWDSLNSVAMPTPRASSAEPDEHHQERRVGLSLDVDPAHRGDRLGGFGAVESLHDEGREGVEESADGGARHCGSGGGDDVWAGRHGLSQPLENQDDPSLTVPNAYAIVYIRWHGCSRWTAGRSARARRVRTAIVPGSAVVDAHPGRRPPDADLRDPGQRRDRDGLRRVLRPRTRRRRRRARRRTLFVRRPGTHRAAGGHPSRQPVHDAARRGSSFRDVGGRTDLGQRHIGGRPRRHLRLRGAKRGEFPLAERTSDGAGGARKRSGRSRWSRF